MALWWWPGEPTFRKVGLALQLLGVGTVALGIRDTRRQLKVPPYLRQFADWARGIPLPWRRRNATASISGVVAATSFAEGAAWTSAAPGSDLATRVLVLENNIASLQASVSKSNAVMRERMEATAAEVAAEVQTRTEQVSKLDSLLKALHVGGLDISAVGLVWLAVGLVLATISVELNAWLFP